MKNTLKIAGLLAVGALSSLMIVPNVSHAQVTSTCESYDCLSVVREKANKFYVTKKVFALTNEFIGKVEAKAKEKYLGIDTKDGLAYQQRIYTRTSQKFLEVSKLLKTENFQKSIKNATRLSHICYDLAQIFKVRSQIAAGTYNGGNYYYDKYWKFEKVVITNNSLEQLQAAAKALKDALNDPKVIKNNQYEVAKTFYNDNEGKLNDKTLTTSDADALAKKYKEHKDALSWDNGNSNQSSNNGQSANSTANDTIVGGEKVAAFQKELTYLMNTSGKTDHFTIQKLFDEFFGNQVMSGYRVDAEYAFGLADGANGVINNNQFKSDFSKYLTSMSNGLTPIVVGEKAEEFDVVHTNMVKFFPKKIVGVRANGETVETEALGVINDYFKGYFDRNDSYYGFAPFVSKISALDFVKEQKIAGGKVVKLGESNKYAVLFPAKN